MVRAVLRASVIAAGLAGVAAVALAVAEKVRQAQAPAPAGRAGRPSAGSVPAETRAASPVTPAPKRPAATEMVEFYNMRTRSTVAVPQEQVRKRRMVRTTEAGRRQERYGAGAEVEVGGLRVRLFKFISKDQFDALDVPEEQQ
jgi:hypothetical protein